MDIQMPVMNGYEATRNIRALASNRCEIKKANEIKMELETLNEFRDELSEIISKKTGKSAKKILEITENDTFF